MMKWYLGAGLVALLLISPFIYLNVWGVRATLWMGADEQFQADLAAGKTSADQAPEFPTSPLQWLQDRSELKAAFNLEGMNKERVVSFAIDLTFDELLADGEDMPDAELIPLYAEARAPQYLMQFCPEILNSVGNKCIVISSHVSVAKDGAVRLSGDLAYLPTYDLGVPADESGYDLLTSIESNTDKGQGLLPEFNPTTRVEFMDHAVGNCAKLRAEYGNCILSDIRFGNDTLSDYELRSYPENAAPVRLKASAWYSVYMLDSPETLQKFHDTVKGFEPS